MHKPTFFPAVAKSSTVAGGYKSTQQSVKDQAAHTSLKFRQVGQHSQEEMRQENLKNELLRREAALLDEKRQAIAMVEREEKSVKNMPLLLTSAPDAIDTSMKKFDDTDADFGDNSDDSLSDSR